MKKGSLVGIILAEQCFFYCTCTISMKNIRNIIFAIEYIRIGIWNDILLVRKKKKKEVDYLNLSITLIKAIPILSQFKNS